VSWNTLVKVARFHLNNWVAFVAGPWLILAFTFAVNLVIFASTPSGGSMVHYAGALSSIYIMFAVVGGGSVGGSMSFALALGVSRRSFYAGTFLLAAGLAVADGLILTLLQSIERATGGWGLNLLFFRVLYLFAGPWYLTWLTAFVGLILMFAYGMWYGLIYKRSHWPGVLTFIAAQVIVLTAVIIGVSRANGWQGVGHFFTTLTIGGLTAALAALAVLLAAGAYGTIRRITV